MIRREISISGYPKLARAQFRTALHIHTDDGAAEAYFSGMGGMERTLEDGQIEMCAVVSYGRTGIEERLMGVCDGY